MKHILSLSAILLLIGCATGPVLPEWEILLKDTETRIFTYDDGKEADTIMLGTRKYGGIMLDRLFALPHDKDFEFIVTDPFGMSVTISSRDYLPDELILAWNESGKFIVPMLAGRELPADLWVKGVREIELAVPEKAASAEDSLEIVIGERQFEITREQLAITPFYREGEGAYLTSAGGYYQSLYGGVPLAELAALFADLDDLQGIAVAALDGFQMRYSMEEILNVEDGVWILAWNQDGEDFDESFGPYRTVKIGTPVPVIEGRRSARQAVRLILKLE